MKLLIRHRLIIIIFIIAIIIVSFCIVLWFINKPAFSPIIPPKNKESVKKIIIENKVDLDENNVTDQNKITQPEPIVPIFDKSKYSTTDPSSIWVVVNKQHPLNPNSYSPIDLTTTVGAVISNNAVTDFNAMNSAALAVGINFTIVSSFRSFDTQNYLYNNYVATYGQTASDTFSARPGYSEHQTGLTVDLGSSTGSECNLDDCFGTTAEGQWLSNHAFEYGFIVRYPADKTSITGYKSEPWHFRYIGRDLAMKMKNSSISTLEEFFDISGGETYL
jgi:D-alanyl-D-alanine carboxypeptidase